MIRINSTLLATVARLRIAGVTLIDGRSAPAFWLT
jgi:hypothetical protein